jgi:hypothetical protein
VQENQNALKGTPLKAFLHQDHQSHIQVHMMLMQDPMIQQFIGQNPQAPKIMGAITAHIAEHVGYKMRQQIEQQLGMPLPPEDEKLPPQIEIALSGMMAQAAQQVLMQNQAQAAQMQAQQQAQDPVLQIQMQELQLKGQELELKKQKMLMDAAAQGRRTSFERARSQRQAWNSTPSWAHKSKSPKLKRSTTKNVPASRWVLTSQRVKPRWIYKRVLLRSKIVATNVNQNDSRLRTRIT